MPHLADRIIAPRVEKLLRILDRQRAEVTTLLDIGCGNGWFCHATAKRGILSVASAAYRRAYRRTRNV